MRHSLNIFLIEDIYCKMLISLITADWGQNDSKYIISLLVTGNLWNIRNTMPTKNVHKILEYLCKGQ